MKFNITLHELERALEFAEEYGTSEFATVTLERGSDNPILNSLYVSKCGSSTKNDITEYEAA